MPTGVYPRTSYHSRRISDGAKGHHKVSDETRKKISQALLGNQNAPSKNWDNLIGKRFGNLIILGSFIENDRRFLMCRCDCEKIKNIRADNVLNGRVTSCGHGRAEHARELFTKHGDTAQGIQSRLYTIWQNMKQRCSNKEKPGYKWYGQKGIEVCKEWLNFSVFKKWALANGYQGNLTIDRIKNNEDYKPGNCQWLTLSENVRRRFI